MAYNKIILYGNQKIDYLCVESTKIDKTDDRFQGLSSPEPTWGVNTVLLARFNKDLVAGNADLGDSLKDFTIYRKKKNSNFVEYVKTIGKDDNFLVDYKITNNSEYVYYMYPSSDDETLPAIESNSVKPNFDYWSLMVVDETDKQNEYTLGKLFKFELNLEKGAINNNTEINVVKNFTPYPHIQKGNSNYWSGELSSLIGFVSCKDEYVQTPNMIEELKALSLDGRRKFLRDIEGHIFEVDIVSPVNIDFLENLENVKRVNINWAEIGSVDGISITNPPQMTTWILTNTGTPLRYEDYVWCDSAIWNDDQYWTENIELENIESSLGRNIM